MIRNYFRVVDITIEKIIIINTQAVHEVPGTSSDGLLKVLTFRTYKGPSGDSQGTNTKIEKNKKLFLFLQEKQIFTSSRRECPRGVYGTQLRDVCRTKWWDVVRTSVGRRSNMIFEFKLTSTLNLLWQVTQAFIVNGSSEKFNEQYSGSSNNLNRHQIWWV